MSAQAQELIAQARSLISKEDYSHAMALLRKAPADRTGWTPHENDEVLCLVEFLECLNDRALSTVRL